MKKRLQIVGILLIVSILAGEIVFLMHSKSSGSDSSAASLPNFQLSYDADQFYMEEDGGICSLRPASLSDDEELSESGITIQYLPGTTSDEAAYSNRQSALDTWFLVTELEAVESLNGIGFHATQKSSDYSQIVMEDSVFVPDSQGGCFSLTARYRASQYALGGETLWNILNTFRTAESADTASETPSRRLGQIRNAAAQGSTWQEAYRTILCAPEDYLTDVDYSRSLSAALGQEISRVYLGIYDFDSDSVPELIFGDGISAAVFGYAGGSARKLGELCDTESPWNINGLSFSGGILRAECNGSGCGKYIFFGCTDGEYKLGIYSNMSTERILIDGESVSMEELERTFPMDTENYRTALRRTYSDGAWQIEAENGSVICVDENFDFSLFSWE